MGNEYDKQRDVEAEGQRAAVYHSKRLPADAYPEVPRELLRPQRRNKQAELISTLERIRDYPPEGGKRTDDGYPLEVVYDEWAYRRMVDSYREAIDAALALARKGGG